MERLTVYRTPILTLDPNAKAGGGMVEVVKLADHQQTVERLERELSVIHHKYHALVNFYDKHNGTPCEQIRHQQEVEQLQQRVADLQGQVALTNERVKVWETQATNMQAVNADRCAELELARQRVAQLEGECWKEHVPVAGTQHDPANGLIHGYCIRCRREWPCEWSPEGKLPTYTALQADHARVLGLVQALPVVSTNVLPNYMKDMRQYDKHDYSAFAALLEYRASLPAQPAQGGA